jgi:hypothetical protein
VVFCAIKFVSLRNQTIGNFPSINAFIKEQVSLFHDMRLYELHMQAMPSPEGGEIVVTGYIHDRTTYDWLVKFYSLPIRPPVKIIWEEQIDPVRAPSHNID